MNPSPPAARRFRPLDHRGRTFLLSERDVKILHFIWKWKLASTATLHETIGRPNSSYSTYKALERLEKQGHVEAVVSQQYRFTAWQLTDQGFESIRESLGDLIEEGFLSENRWHDRNALAFQLGEWSTYAIPGVTHFTEQEMRRRSVDDYPAWVPRLKDRRADGYTRIATSGKSWVIAYEVELWPKSVAHYESILRFYRASREIDHVFWLVGDPLVKEQIQRAKACLRDETDAYHGFVDLKKYQLLGWDAPIENERSETLSTIRKSIRGMLGDPYGDYIGTNTGHSTVSVHYDPFKILGKPRPYRP